VWKGHPLAPTYWGYTFTQNKWQINILFNPLNAELNPICHLLALLGAHHILHVSRVRVNSTIPEHEMLNKYANECDEHNYDRTTHSFIIYPVSSAITSNNSAWATKVSNLQFHTALSMFNTNNFATHSTSIMICLKCSNASLFFLQNARII
jgi:hypothetical protein